MTGSTVCTHPGACGATASPSPWVFESSPRAAGKARRTIRRQLLCWGLTALTDDATLIASELVTNAVVHGSGSVSLTARLVTSSPRNIDLHIEVTDHGHGWESGHHASRLPVAPLSDGGRGLHIVRATAHLWGASRTPDGCTVWARLPAGSLRPVPRTRPEPRGLIHADLSPQV
ncbi:ATP-binding protein [Wenjunlia tyrosinilytica]|uniref:Histidine kinase/HSP90-like ATPase domain-containing protein n=1 Tax=Wenjunlia tyrosinilytica TaxID=1544741 RepID=A0A917ZX38_9ACTN|nr:ATP-binding protein [Wenjunlia tyrosinilytica]GGO97833.1 hypothetical protein GCM10012280_60550 [Wenjunlia tyrosinilytica]